LVAGRPSVPLNPFPLHWREGIKGRGDLMSAESIAHSVERKYFSLCAMRIFTPILTLPRRGGGNFEVIEQPL